MKFQSNVLVVMMLIVLVSGKSFAQIKLTSELSHEQAEISQQQAVSIAQRNTQGRLLSVQRADDHYRIKILNHKGAVHIVTINTKSGEIDLSR
ncbi:MAG: PepSY domain-containing protein [Nitrosomonas sp.]|nr:PepSY domain-containing protein [Nitrosomonas sp.]